MKKKKIWNKFYLSAFSFLTIPEPRFHRLYYVYLLLWQKCQVMEGFGFEYNHNWSWLFNLRTNPHNNFSVFEDSSDAEEQCLLSHNYEPARDAVSVQSALHRWSPIEQECRQVWNNSIDSTLLESDDERLVFRVHIHNLWPNYQRIIAAEDEIYLALCICCTSNLCFGEWGGESFVWLKTFIVWPCNTAENCSSSQKMP